MYKLKKTWICSNLFIDNRQVEAQTMKIIAGILKYHLKNLENVKLISSIVFDMYQCFKLYLYGTSAQSSPIAHNLPT